jgi:hypothetical protein
MSTQVLLLDFDFHLEDVPWAVDTELAFGEERIGAASAMDLWNPIAGFARGFVRFWINPAMFVITNKVPEP